MPGAYSLLLAVLVFAASCGVPGGTAASPPAVSRPTPATCVGHTDPVVHFKADDGTNLGGPLLGRGPATVVLAPQSDQSLCAWLPFARQLAQLGFQALPLDLPSAAPFRNSNWDHYLVAAVNYLRGRSAVSVMLLGASLGGAASMAAAAEATPPVAALVNLSGERRVAGLDADAAVAKAAVPLLIVASEDDQYLNAADAQALYAESAASDKHLELVTGSAHGTAILDGPDGPRIGNLIIGFLRSHGRAAA